MDYVFLWRPVQKAICPSWAEFEPLCPEGLNGEGQLFYAAGITLEISVYAMVAGMIVALFLALGRMSAYSSWKPLNAIIYFFSTVWIELARNTPSVFQLYFFYFGLGAFGIFLGSKWSVFTALTFLTAGYMAETFRGGFEAIPANQMKSARSLGMSSFQAYSRIVIPQVLRIVYLPMTNQFIWVILLSSLGTLVGFRELTGETDFLQSRTFRTFEFFLAAAVIYYLITKFVLGCAYLIKWAFLKEV